MIFLRDMQCRYVLVQLAILSTMTHVQSYSHTHSVSETLSVTEPEVEPVTVTGLPLDLLQNAPHT